MGLVDNDSGSVNIEVSYMAVLLRPFPNEVLDAVVTSATEVIIWVSDELVLMFLYRLDLFQLSVH
jgi:DNA-directed RNA polymerase subunit E'/Rpb7